MAITFLFKSQYDNGNISFKWLHSLFNCLVMPEMSRISPSWLLLLVPLVGLSSTDIYQFSKTYGNIQYIDGVHVAKTPASMPLDPLDPSTEIPIHKSSSYDPPYVAIEVYATESLRDGSLENATHGISKATTKEPRLLRM
jgi:hypothetical protein